MTPYLILLGICLMCFFFAEKKWAGPVSLLALFVISAFRGDTVGTDTWRYLHETGQWREMMASINGMEASSTSSVEVITNAVYFLITALDLHPRTILLFFSGITIGALPLISKRLKAPTAVLAFFFLTSSLYIYSLNVARQVAAVMVVGYGATFICDDSKLKSLLFFPFIAAAAGIHATSLFFIPLYLCRFIKPNYSLTAILSVGLILLFTLNVFSVSGILQKAIVYIPSYADTYGRYIGAVEEITLLGRIVPFVIVCVQVYLLKYIDSKYYALFIVSIVLPVLTNGMHHYFQRLFFPFTLIAFMIYPLSYMSEKKRKTIRRILSVMVIPLVYMFIRSLSAPDTCPYVFGF